VDFKTRRFKMSVNQLETTLEAVTNTIAHLEKSGNCDPKLLEDLKRERKRILEELNVHSGV
jgi:hypothetical protein